MHTPPAATARSCSFGSAGLLMRLPYHLSAPPASPHTAATACSPLHLPFLHCTCSGCRSCGSAAHGSFAGWFWFWLVLSGSAATWFATILAFWFGSRCYSGSLSSAFWIAQFVPLLHAACHNTPVRHNRRRLHTAVLRAWFSLRCLYARLPPPLTPPPRFLRFFLHHSSLRQVPRIS